MKRRSTEEDFLQTPQFAPVTTPHLYAIPHTTSTRHIETTPLSLAISDPVYAPVIEAITQLHETTKEKYKIKIKKLKQEAAAQIQSLCHQLLQTQQALSSHQEKLAVQEKNYTNHHSEITSLQEQLKEDSEKYQEQIERLKQEKEVLSHQLATLQQKQHVWQLSTTPLEEEIQQLSRQNKEKTAQLIKVEHELQQAHQTRYNDQLQIESLENKIKKMEGEFFEKYWIQNKPDQYDM